MLLNEHQDIFGNSYHPLNLPQNKVSLNVIMTSLTNRLRLPAFLTTKSKKMLQRDRTLVTSAIPRCSHQLGFEAAAVTSRPMLVDLSMLLKDNCNSFCIAAISHDVKDDLCGFDRNVLQLRVGC